MARPGHRRRPGSGQAAFLAALLPSGRCAGKYARSGPPDDVDAHVPDRALGGDRRCRRPRCRGRDVRDPAVVRGAGRSWFAARADGRRRAPVAGPCRRSTRAGGARSVPPPADVLVIAEKAFSAAPPPPRTETAFVRMAKVRSSGSVTTRSAARAPAPSPSRPPRRWPRPPRRWPRPPRRWLRPRPRPPRRGRSRRAGGRARRAGGRPRRAGGRARRAGGSARSARGRPAGPAGHASRR